MSKMRILIVEDEPNMVAGLRDNFEFEGYEVLTAADGVEGLERALHDQPDLVLLDVMMPIRSGYDVCARIRERADWRHIKVVMLSAKGREAEVNKVLAMGADLYVTKPFSTRELMARIEGLLEPVS